MRSATAGADRPTRRPSSASVSACVRLQFLDQTDVRGVEQAVVPLIRSHIAVNSFGLPFKGCASRASDAGRCCAACLPTRTSSARRSSTTSGRRSPCCCSRGSACSGVAWLRIATAAVVFAAVRRPWRAWSRPVVVPRGRHRGDERLLLRGHRPAAARHGRRDRVRRGHRRGRRGHADGAQLVRARTGGGGRARPVQRAAGRPSCSASRSRSPTPPCSRCTSSARTACRGCRGSTAWARRCSSRWPWSPRSRAGRRCRR